MTKTRLHAASVEWPTWGLLGLCYGVWALGTVWLPGYSYVMAFIATVLATALYSSLSHEVLHGHPTRWQWLNDALVFPALCPPIPYVRFKDTHLAHHRDQLLTDPYDDPESNYLDPAHWVRLPVALKVIYRLNNTLLGRMVIGPILGQITFMVSDARAIWAGDRRVAFGWALHIPAVALVMWWMLSVANMPIWLWALSVYAGLAILKIRTYLEHRAHASHRARSVVIEDRGLLSLLFLNNNFHAVHHAHPKLPWYDLPHSFAARREAVLARNDGYYYRNYTQIFRRYFLRAKDPVPHPLWPFAKK
jgi:fatty acid desaturase